MDIQNAKESYNTNQFDKFSADMKSQQNIINDLIGENLKKDGISDISRAQGVIYMYKGWPS